ncbi:MAG: hypothetical protein JSV84_02760 [Gemmatimonadota bacterium]|nr:MAG: hypothetical protein JSV84_02760 [Gemmatimonadota bacterium]
MNRLFALPHIHLELQSEYLLLGMVAFAISVFLAYLLYRYTNPPVSRGLRRILFVFRCIALFVLLSLLLEPVITLLIIRHERPVVAVLVDDSASMTITDREGNRKVVLDSLLRSGAIQDLSENYDLAFYHFADDVIRFHPDRVGSSLVDGKVTNIGGALQAARDSLRDENLQAFLLLTDGGNNVGQDPSRVAQSLKHPVYAVGIGDTTEQKDIGLIKLITNDITYTENETSVEISIRSNGLGGTRIPIQLKDRNTLVDSQHLLLSSTGGEQTVTLHYTPRTEGTHKYAVTVPVQEGETVTQNNRREFVVRVLKSKIKVFVASGSPGFEVSFLKRALEKDKDIDVTVAVAKKGGGYYQDPFPRMKNDLVQFDTILFLALPRSSLGQTFEELVYDFVVSEGKSLLVLPGKGQSTWTAYGDSPLAEILPVQIASTREPLQSATLTPHLTAEGLSHPVTRFDEDPTLNERKWADMPPLLGAVRNCQPKLQAMVLSVHPQLKIGENPIPFIALQRFQKGKTMIINGLPLWRWNFMMWGIGKSDEEYVQLIINAVRWLTTQEESDLLTITTSKRMYHGGEPIDLLAQVYDEQYRTLDGAEVVITVTPADTSGTTEEGQEFGFTLLQRGEGWGRYEGSLKALPPGDYQFTGSALYRGRSLGQSSGKFSVEEYSMEFENTRMNVDLLRRLAQTSGGTYHHFKDIYRLIDQPEGERSVRSEHRPFLLWDNPILLGIFLFSVFIEWTLRKRKGMV